MVKKDNYTLYLGSMLDVLDEIPENSIDSVVTDPPYEINFMNKGWDNTGIVFKKETWQKVLKVLKPGGHLLAFNHSRTFHRMAVAIEDAGFQIRDTILWLYGSGFPKSHNISIGIDKKLGAMRHRGVRTSFAAKTVNGKTLENGKEVEQHKGITDEAKQWDGWGTALKPSYEPIIMARKPLDGTIADNVLKHGVGGINVDECRVALNGEKRPKGSGNPDNSKNEQVWGFVGNGGNETNLNGRFPANTIHDGSNEVTDGMWDWETNNDASRFFYTAKASKKDRDEGLDTFNSTTVDDGRQKSIDNAFQRGETLKKNIHPTVKPTDLMQYLVRLVTPKGGKVLDPFMGSGSTGKAAMIENNERDSDYHFIGIDLNQEYIDIADARIEYGLNYKNNKAKEEELQKKIIDQNQVSFEL